METKKEMSHKMLLMLDYGYTVNDLLNTLEERRDLIKMGFTFNEIFKAKWLRLKAEDERNDL
ncbi:hypothetical protein [Enterococcus phage VEsP-2]|nr:hypothetical protein [Enterococcus phage VEsP-2]